MSHEIWMVGCGNMGRALVLGAIESGRYQAQDFVVVDLEESKLKDLVEKGARTRDQSKSEARVFVMAVKPQHIRTTLQELPIMPGDTVVSVAAGITTDSLKEGLPESVWVARAMPNTPVLVRRGVTGFFGPKEARHARAIFETVGEVFDLEKESDFHALTAVSGSGPAYVFVALSALSDAGVSLGLPRPMADRLAVLTLHGASELAMSSELNFEGLKDQVTSPGGTTIAGVLALEAHGFRNAIQSAVAAASKRSAELAETLS